MAKGRQAKKGNSNAKGIILGIIIGIIAAAGAAVGMVFLLITINGGSTKLDVADKEKVKTDGVSEDGASEDANAKEDADIKESPDNTEANASAGKIIPDADYAHLTDNYGEMLKGIDNKAKLQYVLGIAEGARGKSDNYITFALGELWYNKEIENVYSQSGSASENQAAYSIETLDGLYSFITDDSINESNIPTSIAKLENGEILYVYNDVSTPDRMQVVIKDIKYTSGDKMYIEYLYKATLSSTGDSGIYGSSVAICEPLEDGKYKLSSLEPVYRMDYRYSKIDDESFNSEFESLK